VPALPFQAGVAPALPSPRREPPAREPTGTLVVEPEADAFSGMGPAVPLATPALPRREATTAPPVPLPLPPAPEPPVTTGGELPSPPAQPAPRGKAARPRWGDVAERVELSFGLATATGNGPPPKSPGEHFLAAMQRAGEPIDPP
jgi:hypothetical protein